MQNSMQNFTVMINLTIQYHNSEIIQRSVEKEFLAPTAEEACELMERSLDGVRENAHDFGFELLATQILGAVPSHQVKSMTAHSDNEWKTELTSPPLLAPDSQPQSSTSVHTDSSKDVSLITDVDGE